MFSFVINGHFTPINSTKSQTVRLLISVFIFVITFLSFFVAGYYMLPEDATDPYPLNLSNQPPSTYNQLRLLKILRGYSSHNWPSLSNSKSS
jgi:hypothetical protein